MELTDDEANELWEKREQERCEGRAIATRHMELYTAHQNNQLPPVVVNWHTDINEIDLALQYEPIDKVLVQSGLTIIPDVNIEVLFDRMVPGNPQMFREKIMYHDELAREKISSVLYNWINGERLIPPFITVRDKVYGKFFGFDSPDFNDLFATDGKHRINVAYYFGATSIPILVLRVQEEKIRMILGLD